MKIVLVCIGSLQTYIGECVRQLQCFGNNNITILTDSTELHYQLRELIADDSVAITIIHPTSLTEKFENTSPLCSTFRKGFFRHCFKRFIYILEYMKVTGTKEIIHIENDVMLYRNCNDWKNFLTKEIYLVMDSNERCIPSVMFFRDWHLLDKCLNEHNIDENINDMYFWGRCFSKYIGRIGRFPICDTDPNYSKELGIFDAAAIGQYLGGVDPANIPTDSIGFVNETCIEKYDKHTFKWTHNHLSNTWIPIMNKDVKINNLHIHCKSLEKFSSRPKFLGQLQSKLCPIQKDFINGERFQNCASAFIYINKPCFGTTSHIIPDNDKRYIQLSIDTLFDNPKILYINTQELYSFLLNHKRFVKNPFIVISHNSDENLIIKNDDKDIINSLNHYNCIAVYTQNLGDNYHPKLNLLPIGIANSKWNHGNTQIVENVLSKDFINMKNNMIYFYFSQDTNRRVRDECKNELEKKNLEWTRYSYNFEEYLNLLSSYKYAICPEGHGLDSHRLWECIYTQVIPIMKQDSFGELVKQFLHPYPIVLLKDWKDLNINILEDNYVYPSYPFYNIRTFEEIFKS